VTRSRPFYNVASAVALASVRLRTRQAPALVLSCHLRTLSALSVFQRLGFPTVSNSKNILPGCLFWSTQRPSLVRFFRTKLIGSSIRLS